MTHILNRIIVVGIFILIGFLGVQQTKILNLKKVNSDLKTIDQRWERRVNPKPYKHFEKYDSICEQATLEMKLPVVYMLSILYGTAKAENGDPKTYLLGIDRISKETKIWTQDYTEWQIYEFCRWHKQHLIRFLFRYPEKAEEFLAWDKKQNLIDMDYIFRIAVFVFEKYPTAYITYCSLIYPDPAKKKDWLKAVKQYYFQRLKELKKVNEVKE